MRLIVIILSFLLLFSAAPVTAQLAPALQPLVRAQQQSVAECNRIKKERGNAYQKDECQTAVEKLKADVSSWKYWPFTVLAAFLIGSITLGNFLGKQRKAAPKSSTSSDVTPALGSAVMSIDRAVIGAAALVGAALVIAAWMLQQPRYVIVAVSPGIAFKVDGETGRTWYCTVRCSPITDDQRSVEEQQLDRAVRSAPNPE